MQCRRLPGLILYGGNEAAWPYCMGAMRLPGLILYGGNEAAWPYTYEVAWPYCWCDWLLIHLCLSQVLIKEATEYMLDIRYGDIPDNYMLDITGEHCNWPPCP